MIGRRERLEEALLLAVEPLELLAPILLRRLELRLALLERRTRRCERVAALRDLQPRRLDPRDRVLDRRDLLLARLTQLADAVDDTALVVLDPVQVRRRARELVDPARVEKHARHVDLAVAVDRDEHPPQFAERSLQLFLGLGELVARGGELAARGGELRLLLGELGGDRILALAQRPRSHRAGCRPRRSARQATPGRRPARRAPRRARRSAHPTSAPTPGQGRSGRQGRLPPRLGERRVGECACSSSAWHAERHEPPADTTVVRAGRIVSVP